MLSRCVIEFDPEFVEGARRHGLDRFDRLMDEDLGEVVVRKSRHELRRIEVEQDGRLVAYYLRRATPDRGGKVLAQLAKGYRPHSPCVREAMLIRRLQEREIPVMRAIAWGERRTLGVPREGFILVEAVEGHEMLELYRDGDPSLRRRILHAVGRMSGRLNRCGFYSPLRARDLICTTVDPHHAGVPIEMTLIDRETNRPGPRRFRAARCEFFIARGWCKLREMGLDLDLRGTATYLRAYLAEMPPTWRPGVRALHQTVAARIERLTAPGAKYAHVVPSSPG